MPIGLVALARFLLRTHGGWRGFRRKLGAAAALANLNRMREPSFRHYVRARELKAAGMDWTEVRAVDVENRRTRLAADRRRLGNGAGEKPAKGETKGDARG